MLYEIERTNGDVDAMTLQFETTNGGLMGLNGFTLVTNAIAVPKPGSFAIFGVALLGLAQRRRLGLK